MGIHREGQPHAVLRAPDHAARTRFELRCPTPALSPPAWLTELWEFRGRVAWNGGQRPAFRRHDGTFQDRDPHDFAAYHLILREPVDGRPVGCVRYAPLESLPHSRIRELDAATATDLLAAAHRADAEVLEGARLIVDPAWQHRGLASDLLLAGTALARVLGRRLIWGTAGVRDGQERVFLRLGYRCAAAPLVPAPHLDDDLRIIVCDPASVPAEVEARIGAFLPRVRAWLAAAGWPRND